MPLIRAAFSAAALLMGTAPIALSAQLDSAPVGSQITNIGVARANAIVDSVFISRRIRADTIDIGDFAGYLLARLGVPPFEDSLKFRVTADSARIRVTGRLMDFPQEARAELGTIFTFLDSTSVFQAQISMPRADSGLMRFRLERATVRGIPIPDLLLLPALAEYSGRYPVLTSGGRELLVAMPPEATARLTPNGIALYMPETHRP